MTDARIERALEVAVERGEVGVQVAAWQGDELIVDAWIGAADEATGKPVDGDTLFSVFSVSKAFVFGALHLQAERGLVTIDDPVATYWPEYAANGKEGITIRHVIEHRAGVPQMPTDITPDTLGDWFGVVNWLAETTPMAPPGTSMYHSLSLGFIIGEVVRRTDPKGRSYADFLADEILAPIGATDIFFGLPDDQEDRVATLTWGPGGPSSAVTPNAIRLAMVPPAINLIPEIYNLPAVRRAVIPAAGGIMTAKGGARYFALLANRGELDGTRLISEDRLMALTEPRPNPAEIDAGIGFPTCNGVGGFCVGTNHPIQTPVTSRSPHILSHSGAGGSFGWADLDANVGVVIAHNRMYAGLTGDKHPFIPLADAIYEVVNS